MKRAGWITTAAVAAAAVVGGGTVYALTTAEPDPAETPAAIETNSPEPTESIEPAPVESETPAPTTEPTPEVTYTDEELGYIELIQREIAIDGLFPTDEEVLGYGTYVCSELASGAEKSEVVAIPDAPNVPNNIIRSKAIEMLCPDQG